MNIQEFSEAVNAIRKNRQMVSNAFLSIPQVEVLLADPHTRVTASEGLLAIVSEEPDFGRLYYYADGEAALAPVVDIASSCSKPVVADIVGKGQKAEAQMELLGTLGFSHYSTFVRLSAKSINPMAVRKGIRINSGNAHEAEVIMTLIRGEFDPLFAHIPLIAEIESAIEKNEIKVVRADGALAGFAWFEAVSPTIDCLRYFVVDSRYRGKGFGAALLMNNFKNYQDGQSCYLWIGTYNKTIELYKRVGFVEDGLKDYIMLYERES